MIDLNDPIYSMTDKQRNDWPRFVCRNDAKPWSDGVYFIRFDEPNKALFIGRDLKPVFTNDDSFEEHAKYGWSRRQVSPLAAYALVIEANRDKSCSK